VPGASNNYLAILYIVRKFKSLEKIYTGAPVVAGALILAFIAYSLWSTFKPLSEKTAYSIALHAARNACQNNANREPKLDCSSLKLAHKEYVSPGPNDGSDVPSWTFEFVTDKDSTPWEYRILLNSHGEVISSSRGVQGE